VTLLLFYNDVSQFIGYFHIHGCLVMHCHDMYLDTNVVVYTYYPDVVLENC